MIEEAKVSCALSISSSDDKNDSYKQHITALSGSGSPTATPDLGCSGRKATSRARKAQWRRRQQVRQHRSRWRRMPADRGGATSSTRTSRGRDGRARALAREAPVVARRIQRREGGGLGSRSEAVAWARAISKRFGWRLWLERPAMSVRGTATGLGRQARWIGGKARRRLEEKSTAAWRNTTPI